MASCRDDGNDISSTRCESTQRTRRPRDPTAKCRVTTVTETSDRLVDKFLAMPCETAYSMKLVIGPKKAFQATIVPLEEVDVEERWGSAVRQQLFKVQKDKQDREQKTMGRLLKEQKRVKEAIPRAKTTSELTGSYYSASGDSSETFSSAERSQSSRQSRRSDMGNSLWSLGSSTSL